MPRQYTKRPPEERFWSKVVFPEDSDCWLWASSINNSGYGEFWVEGKLVKAHRWAYEYLIGPIPAGLTIDHLCRVRHCVNASHLEPVTQRINLLRGDTFQARNAAKTHCKSGHPFDLVNTYSDPRGFRGCRMCRRNAASRRYQQRRKALAHGD